MSINSAPLDSVPVGGSPVGPTNPPGESGGVIGALNVAAINAFSIGGGKASAVSTPSPVISTGTINSGPINAWAIGGAGSSSGGEPDPGGGLIFDATASSVLSAESNAIWFYPPQFYHSAISSIQADITNGFVVAINPAINEEIVANDLPSIPAGTLLLLQSSFALEDGSSFDWIIKVADGIDVIALPTTSALQGLTAVSSVGMRDSIRAVWPVVAQAVATLPDDVNARVVAVAALVESLTASGAFSARNEAAALVAVALAAEDGATPSWYIELFDSIQAGASASASLLQSAAALETLTVMTLAQQGATVLLATMDGLVIGDTLTSQAVHGLLVQELVRCTAELVLFGEAFTAVAVTTQGARPISTYLGWNFNAMARIGGRYFGTGEGGLYELTGDSDDGQEIAARIVTGEMDFGSPAIKRIQEAYLGYTAGGDLVLKVIATHEGKVREFWYRAPVMVPGEVSETRIQVGKGLTSRYWQFELINTGGADFDIEVFDMTLLDLSRRI